MSSANRSRPINIRGMRSSSNHSPLSVSMSSSSRVKMKIKPFKKPPTPPKDLYDRTFFLLSSATRAILHKEPLKIASLAPPNFDITPATSLTATNRPGSPTSVAKASPTTTTAVVPSSPLSLSSSLGVPISREELYRSVEDLCVHGYSTRLYADICQVLEVGALYCLQKLTDERSRTWAPGAVQLINEFPTLPADKMNKSKHVVFHETFSISHDSLRILGCVREIYGDYLEYLTFVRSIFLYLDRTYVLGKTKVNSLWDAGIDTFRRHAMYDSEHKDGQTSSVIQTVISATLHQIKCEREGEVVDRVLLRSTIRMLADLPGCFQNQFMPQFLAESMAFFEAEGKKWMENDNSPSEFLAHVERRWNQANEMSVYYLDCTAAKMKNGSNTSPSKVFLENPAFSGKEVTVILASVVEQYLLLPHAESFLLQDKNLHPLLNDDTKLQPDLRRLYVLLGKVSKLDALRSAFGRYGRSTGIKIIQGDANASGSRNNASLKESGKEIIPELLKWKERLETIHRVGFMDDETFGYSATSHTSSQTSSDTKQQNAIAPASTSCLRGVLEDVLNGTSLENNKNHDVDDYGKRVAELLAKHVDLCLRSAKTLAMPSNSNPTSMSAGYETAPSFSYRTKESDPEHLLDKIMSVFRHLQSKDIFEAFYKRDLAKRLLTSKSASTDLERSFISKLKIECGAGYTAKMEGMFKDMDLSREVMSRYSMEIKGTKPSQKMLEGKGQNVDMGVQILTTGYWPIYQQFKDIKLPPQLLNPLTSFENHYKNKYQGRRIVWQHSLGTCNVKGHFPNGTKELILSQYQTLVLVWCFGDMEDESQNGDEQGKGWTMSQVMAKTGIEDKAECERVLLSLSMGKEGTRVLIKDTKSSKSKKKKTRERKSVLEKDTFHFNPYFVSRHSRIRIPSLQAKETAQERDDTHQSVSRDRLYLIDAAVVRIMKARKTISHQALLGEVMKQLRFPATGADVKKRIGGLLDREYMERSAENRDHYNYLA